jgi:hypothetical protein
MRHYSELKGEALEFFFLLWSLWFFNFSGRYRQGTTKRGGHEAKLGLASEEYDTGDGQKSGAPHRKLQASDKLTTGEKDALDIKTHFSIGIIIYGILSVIFSAFISIFIVTPQLMCAPNMNAVGYMITAVCWLACGLGILMRKSWARIGLIFVAGLYIIGSFEAPSFILMAIRDRELLPLGILVAGLGFFISLIVFLIRPKVKQQFIKSVEEKE